MQKLLIFVVPFLLALCFAQAWPQSLEPVEWSEEHIFTTLPQVVAVREGKAIVYFATANPMAASVHYGAFPADEDLTWPFFRFRSKARALESADGYEAELRVYRFESDLYNMAKGSSLERVVVYRVGVMDEEEGIVRYFESRFRYHTSKQDGGDVWALRPCIVEGPFVDLITDRAAVVSLDADSSCFARVSIDGRHIISTDAQGKPLKARHHEILIGALDPSTRYVYRAEIASDNNFQTNSLIWPERSFATAPQPGSRSSFSFAYMSDSRQSPGGGEYGFGGCNYRIAQQFMIDLYRRGADLVLFGGDLVNGYTSSSESFIRQLRTWKKAVEPVACLVPIYEGMGNHEQVGDYFKISWPEMEPITIYTNRAGEESGEALFGSQFVNPRGSIYGFGPPEPEDQWPGVGEDLGNKLTPWGLPQSKGPSYVENVYSFNYDNLHFVSFNTNYWHTGVYYGTAEKVNQALEIVGGNREGYIMNHQLTWLRRDLEAAGKDEDIDWIVLFTHEPAFPNGGHLGDAMFWGRAERGHEGGLNDPTIPSGDVIDMRDRFWTLISSHPKVIAVFFGDEHNYSRTYIDDSVHPDYRHPVWQITSGGAGAPFYGQDLSVPWIGQVKKFTSVPHYCLVRVQGREVQLEVWTRSGRLVEQVVLSDLPR